MVTKPEDFEMILAWSKKSDRIAEGNAMYSRSKFRSRLRAK
jgi:hypothetical protein